MRAITAAPSAPQAVAVQVQFRQAAQAQQRGHGFRAQSVAAGLQARKPRQGRHGREPFRRDAAVVQPQRGERARACQCLGAGRIQRHVVQLQGRQAGMARQGMRGFGLQGHAPQGQRGQRQGEQPREAARRQRAAVGQLQRLEGGGQHAQVIVAEIAAQREACAGPACPACTARAGPGRRGWCVLRDRGRQGLGKGRPWCVVQGRFVGGQGRRARGVGAPGDTKRSPMGRWRKLPCGGKRAASRCRMQLRATCAGMATAS